MHIRKLYDLKKVYRFNSVENRKESTAEHSWSSMVLADYFMSKSDFTLDKLKIYELLMYHDIIELIIGNTVLHPSLSSSDMHAKERSALIALESQLPKRIAKKIHALVIEFLEQKTVESQFARAIEQLDAEVHEMDYKKDWEGWTEEFLRQKKQHYFIHFKEMQEVFETIIAHDKKEGFF